MLPFLKPKKQGAVIQTKYDMGKTEVEHEEGEEDPAMLECAHAVLSAIAMKDAQALAKALHEAFEICDAAPHVEGEHVEEEY